MYATSRVVILEPRMIVTLAFAKSSATLVAVYTIDPLQWATTRVPHAVEGA